VVSLVPSGGGEPAWRELKADEAAGWTTVTLEARPGAPRRTGMIRRVQEAPTSSLTMLVELGPGTPPGAVVWCDEATLVLAHSSH
jgi:hypothetical protein